MKRGLLKGLKAYKTFVFPIETIAEVFPSIFADILKMFRLRTAIGQSMPIGYDWSKLMEFQINLGNCIANNQFNYLDNILLQFLKSYSYVIPPYQFFIKFSNEEEEKFVNTCNAFKGKKWDDIIDVFIDAVYDLFETGKMFNQSIE